MKLQRGVNNLSAAAQVLRSVNWFQTPMRLIFVRHLALWRSKYGRKQLLK